MSDRKKFSALFQKQIALPSDHGSWVFLLSPFLIGVFAAGRWSDELPFLFIGLLAAFFLRQPAAFAVKALSKRRSRRLLPASIFWLSIYSLVGLIAVAYLIWADFGYLLWLAIPGFLVFGWHLWLVSQRSERYQMGIDVIASGVLALSAPAAYWVCLGHSDWIGWILWLLSWLQSASSIVYAFLRLQQRRLEHPPSKEIKWQIGRRALLYSSFNLLFSIILTLTSSLSRWLWIPYLIQFTETFWGITHPAVGIKPTQIGIRQLIISTIFTIAFIIVWTL
jgi:hypothetical protein